MRCYPLAIAALCVLTGSVATAYAAEWSSSGSPRQDNGLIRLSDSDFREYFESRRQIERQSADQRLAQLKSLEACLERVRQGSTSNSCLERTRQQMDRGRQQMMRELAALQKRYGLSSSSGRPMQGDRSQQLSSSESMSWR